VLGIILGIALGREEIVVAATAAGVFAADGGTRCIDGAAARVGVEEAADAPEYLVILAAHRVFRAGLDLRELLSGLLKAQIEMLGQPFDVALGQLDQGIGTTIAGALRAIVHDATLKGWNILIRIRGRSTISRVPLTQFGTIG